MSSVRSFFHRYPHLPWILPAVLVLLIFSIYPFVFNVYYSFYKFSPIQSQFEFVGWQNWVQFFNDSRTLNSIYVTLMYVSIGLAVEFFLGMIIALLFLEEPVGVGIFQSVFLLPMFIPPTIAALMWQLIEHSQWGVLSYYLYQFGLMVPNEPFLGGDGKFSLIGVLLADIWQWTPFMTLILLAGLKSLPEEPFEAARIDGAGVLATFRHITLPMLKPVIGVAILLRIMDLFRVFDYVYVMTSGGPGRKTEVLSYLGYIKIFKNIQWGYGAAVSVFTLAIVLFVCIGLIKTMNLEWW